MSVKVTKEEPGPLDNTEELLDQFERERILVLPSQDGAGTYTLTLRANIKGYPVTLLWTRASKLVSGGSSVHPNYPAHKPPPGYTGEIAYWIPTDSTVWGKVPRATARATAAVLIQFIQAGAPLYMNDCGYMVSVDGVKQRMVRYYDQA